MIAKISGEVLEKTDHSLIVDTGGVGYEVNVTKNDLENCLIGEQIKLNTFLNIRENSQELFGFSLNEAKRLFGLLISVSGVGPKMAMNILDLGPVNQIERAIASGNANYISGASGVGKRLAERVCVDLKEKVGLIVGGDYVSANELPDHEDDAVSALVALGYNRSQALRVLAKVDPDLSLEERVKLSLREL